MGVGQWVDWASYPVNDAVQGFVDWIPFGRRFVDNVHALQQYNIPMDSAEYVDYSKLRDTASWPSLGGQVAGIAWNFVTAQAVLGKFVTWVGGFAGSKLPWVAKLATCAATCKTISTLPAAQQGRICMEITRALCYLMKFHANQLQLKAGKLTRKQFNDIVERDIVTYRMGSVCWCLPNQAGIMVACGGMLFGTMMGIQNMQTATDKKR